MGNKYSDAQIMWLEVNGYSRVWKNRAEFRNTFNKVFGLNVGVYAFNNLIGYYHIKICTRQTESVFTDEQKQWLIEGAKSGKFKTCKHLTDTYNAVFKECRKSVNITGYLAHRGISLNTAYKELTYTKQMDEWLCENYLSFSVADAVIKFNELFGTHKSNAAITHHCRQLGLKRRDTKFRTGYSGSKTRSLGSLSYRKDFIYIKVNMKNDKSSWVPYHKYLWEQNYGKIPEGSCVVFLNGDTNDVSLQNLALIDRRGTPTMAKYGWWTDNKVITKDGIQWCNLYCAAKDTNIL